MKKFTIGVWFPVFEPGSICEIRGRKVKVLSVTDATATVRYAHWFDLLWAKIKRRFPHSA